jgi:hypothetical protein
MLTSLWRALRPCREYTAHIVSRSPGMMVAEARRALTHNEQCENPAILPVWWPR